ncbi:MAG: hypothetical protein AAGA92_09800 [Planctomycetota bacterium]
MSWRTGSTIFLEIWPILQKHISDRRERIEFAGELLKLFVHEDMDLWEVEDVDVEIRAAMRLSEIAISEPERWSDDPDLLN